MFKLTNKKWFAVALSILAATFSTFFFLSSYIFYGILFFLYSLTFFAISDDIEKEKLCKHELIDEKYIIGKFVWEGKICLKCTYEKGFWRFKNFY